jgi:hypothetical protein
MMEVEVALSCLATRRKVESELTWFAGYLWKLEVVWSDRVDEMGKSTIGVFIRCSKGAIGCTIPVPFDAIVVSISCTSAKSVPTLAQLYHKHT